MGIKGQHFQRLPTAYQTSPSAVKAPQKVVQVPFLTSICPPNTPANLKGKLEFHRQIVEKPSPLIIAYGNPP